MLRSVLKKLGYILYSTRPSACLMVGVLVLVAYRPLESEVSTAIKLFIAALTGSAFCFLANDIYDREKDQKNGKNRPIATGLLTKTEALFGALFFLFIYMLSCWFVGKLVFALAIVSLVLFITYSFVNAIGGFIANLIVAFCASGSLWGVAIIRDYDATLFYFSGLIFLMTIVREILLDWLDVDGDRSVGKPSLPIVIGKKRTANALLGLIALSTVYSFVLLNLAMVSVLSIIFICLGLVITWVFMIRFFRDQSNEQVLFNIRVSHLTFLFIVLGVLLR